MSTTNLKPISAEEATSWEATVSDWVDGNGDIRSEELDSPYGRQLWDSYHLIGDVMRSEELAILTSDKFYAKLSKALDDEPVVFAPRNLSERRSVKVALSSVALAAVVAVVTWAAIPYFGVSPNATLLATKNDDFLLVDYMDAHRDLSGMGPLSREVSYDFGIDAQ